MPKTIITAWVKYVHKQRINSSIIGGLLSEISSKYESGSLQWLLQSKSPTSGGKKILKLLQQSLLVC